MEHYEEFGKYAYSIYGHDWQNSKYYKQYFNEFVERKLRAANLEGFKEACEFAENKISELKNKM